MKRSRPSFIAIFCLAALFFIAILQGNRAWARDVLVDDGWFEIFLNGQKIGREHVVLETSTFQGKKCYHFREYSEGRLAIDEKKSNVVTITNAYLGMDMKPLYFKEENREEGQVITTEIIITGKDIAFRKKLGSTVTVKRIPYVKGCVFSTSGLLVKHRGLRVGNRFSVKVIYEEKGTLEREDVEVLKRDRIEIEGSPVECYLVKVQSSAIPGIPIWLWVDEKGRNLKMKTVTLTALRTSKEKASKFVSAGTYSNRIAVAQLIPPLADISRMKLTMRIECDEPGEVLENCLYQTVEKDSRNYAVTLHEIRPGTGGKKESAESLAPYLKPSVLIESGDPLIKKKAREIAGDEKETGKRIELLCTWVYEHLRKVESKVALQSATETLRSESGDCTEHATLFCALCRALSIPARQASGLVFTGSSFGFHAWAEAYNGQWVPVDATLNRVGIPACYIFLGADSEGKPTIQSTVKLVKMLSNTAISVLSVTAGDSTFIPADPSTFMRGNGDRIDHLLWGITLQKPAGWTAGTAGASRLFLDSPGGSRIALFPVYSTFSASPQAIEELARSELEKSVKNLVFGAPRYNSTEHCNLFELSWSGECKGREYKGKAVAVASRDRVFLAVLSYPVELFSEALLDFEKTLGSIELRSSP
ncbi:MAG: transglutaminase-like domain-containing protein [Candidatus Eremiobacteraeota bacterium]|nr:transglutaminase-like domain-containing protein [Candidatus Eremiobacteraeota bacterium]